MSEGSTSKGFDACSNVFVAGSIACAGAGCLGPVPQPAAAALKACE